jgi:hypothetical protein
MVPVDAKYSDIRKNALELVKKMHLDPGKKE